MVGHLLEQGQLMDEYQASIQDLQKSYEWALSSRAIWEGVAVLLNEDLKNELGPVEYAKRYGDSALSTLYDIVADPGPKHLPKCREGYGCDPRCQVHQ